MGGASEKDLEAQLSGLEGEVYMATPATVDVDHITKKFHLVEEMAFFPHFSGEDPPFLCLMSATTFAQIHDCVTLKLYHTSRLQ